MPKHSVSKQKHELYYEAIIQLRPANNQLLSYIDNQIEKRNDVFISKIDELKTGIDIYISSRKFAMALGKKLKKAFPGELKLSRTLFSQDRQTSKKIYRVTVLFRLKNEVL